MKHTFYIAIILSLIITSGVTQKAFAQDVPQADSLALVAIYNNMGGATWTDNSNWLSGSVASWKGVTVTEGRVTRLELYSNNLQDSIPAETGNLTALEKLNFGDNPITGPIPPEISTLTNLVSLSLYMTAISGSIPPEIGQLTKLEKFQMNTSKLDGPIPIEFGSLISLTYLNIAKGKLSGSLPATMGNLVNLEQMYLYENQLEGTIPPEMGNMSSLTALYLSENLLSGSIPSELANLYSLTQLNLSENQLSGPIPAQLGNLSSLTNLSLQDNQLSGSIPESIANLLNLTYLGLHLNQFDGAIPPQLGNLAALKYFYAYDNQLTGTIPAQIWSLKNLLNFYVSENQLSGTISPEIANCENLERLSIASNKFEGAIPQEINNLSKLFNLYIPGNQFDDLPALDSLTALSSLTIRDNKFTFEDIEPNIGIPSGTFYYSPQDSVGACIDTVLEQGAGLLLSVDVGGSTNSYQWLRNDIEIQGAVESNYQITSASAADTGSYVCQITNALATDLTLYSRDVSVKVEGITSLNDASDLIPKTTVLHQNYPNPFNPVTTISYQIVGANHYLPLQIDLSIYNILGKKVATLVSEKQSAGYYQISWDASSFSSGLYFYKLETSGNTISRRMQLIK